MGTTIEKIIGTTIVAFLLKGCLTFSGIGISPQIKGFERHPVDQVFSDSSSYTAIWTDKNNLIKQRVYLNDTTPVPLVKREKAYIKLPEGIKTNFLFYSNYDKNPYTVAVIKDLRTGERGYANSINFNAYFWWPSRGRNYAYTEIHMSDKLSPGITYRNGKNFSSREQRGEIQ